MSDKLYRIVDSQGRIYRSNQFRGFYESKESAERALKRLPKTRWVWDSSEQKSRRVLQTYELQEADVTWTSSTSSTSSPTSASSSTLQPETRSTFTSTTE